MIRKCLKKAAALAAALMMALMFIPAGAYAVYAADAGNTVVVTDPCVLTVPQICILGAGFYTCC